MRTFSPKKVGISYGGVPITGFAPDTFIKVSFEKDAFETDVGADGEVARLASADESGTIEVTLLQSSPSNDYLSSMLSTDRLTNLNTAPFFAKDASGTSQVLASEAWIKKAPDFELSGSKTPRTWVFASGSIKLNAGSN
jgi:Protein of unknown function (DUF3277)